MSLDVVEQQRGAFRQAGGDFGDAADLEARIGAGDAPQRAELVDKADEFPQVFVHGKSLYMASLCPCDPLAGRIYMASLCPCDPLAGRIYMASLCPCDPPLR